MNKYYTNYKKFNANAIYSLSNGYKQEQKEIEKILKNYL